MLIKYTYGYETWSACNTRFLLEKCERLISSCPVQLTFNNTCKVRLMEQITFARPKKQIDTCVVQLPYHSLSGFISLALG